MKDVIQGLQDPSLDTLRSMEITDATIDLLLGALADQLQALDSQFEIVVIGGSALTALGLVKRATRDVDLLAVAIAGELRRAEPLPPALFAARAAVAADFGLDENWLNAGPTDLLRWGLPEGFMSRVVSRSYGRTLVCPLRWPPRPDSLQALCHG
jgi:hypothetical protein